MQVEEQKKAEAMSCLVEWLMPLLREALGLQGSSEWVISTRPTPDVSYEAGRKRPIPQHLAAGLRKNCFKLMCGEGIGCLLLSLMHFFLCKK